MPTYRYECADCGFFEERRSVGQAGEPAYCPVCGQSARRNYAGIGVIAGSGTLRDRIERSAEPVVVSQRELYLSPQRHAQAGGRPWQISH